MDPHEQYWDDDGVEERAAAGGHEPRIGTAIALTRVVSRRDELREALARPASIGARDAAIAAGIGLLGAIPATSFDEKLGEWLSSIPGVDKLPWQGGAPSGAEALRRLRDVMQGGRGIPDLSTLMSSPTAQERLPMMGDLVDQTGHAGQAQQILSRGVQAMQSDTADFVEAFAIPDGEDVFGSALVRVASDLWVRRRGWKKGEKGFHEFKALAYGTTAVVSLPLNPNPIAVGIAGWHLARALMASRALTRQVVELTELAIAEGRVVMAEWDAEVARSASLDGWVRAAIRTPMSPDPADWAASSQRLRNAFGGES